MRILKEKIIRYEAHRGRVKAMDQGELIRCKDCKFLKISNGWQVGNTFYCGEFANCEHPNNNHISTEIDGYCFRAKKREE